MSIQQPEHWFCGWASEKLVPLRKEGAVKKEIVLLIDLVWLSVQTYAE